MVETVFLMRHGLRLDGADEAYWPYYAKLVHDTPLSYEGAIQAKENGEFLRATEKVDHIFTSPFFRAVQTASLVAKELGLSVNIEHGFMEGLSTEWFDTYPEFITREEAAVVFPNINKDYVNLVEPTYPENSETNPVFNRVKKALDQILETYDGNILIVGHGASIGSSSRYLNERRTGYNGRMCSLHKYVRDNDQWNYVLSTTDHLTYIDDMSKCPGIINTIPVEYRKQQQIEVVQFPIERGLKQAKN